MEIQPPRRRRDACYRMRSVTAVKVNPEVLTDPAIIKLVIDMLAEPQPIIGSGRWPYQAVGPASDIRYEPFCEEYRARRDWAEPAW